MVFSLAQFQIIPHSFTDQSSQRVDTVVGFTCLPLHFKEGRNALSNIISFSQASCEFSVRIDLSVVDITL